MPKPNKHSTVCNSFLVRLKRFELTRVKLESLYARRRVSRRDLEHTYGALFLAAITSFEGMLEILFLKLLCKKFAHPKKIRALVEFDSDSTARRIVFGGRNYVDWLPYEQTIGRARLFFASGRPFTYLEKQDRKAIEIWCVTRNALAHQSHFAQRRFYELVIEPRTLLPNEKRPTAFLRSLHSTAPDVTQYEQLAGEMISVAKKLVR